MSDVSAEAVGLDKLKDKILGFISDYMDNFNKSIKLRILSQRYNKIIRRYTTMDLKDVLAQDPRFKLQQNENGGYIISVVSPSSIEGMVLRHLKESGGKLTDEEMRLKLKGTGIMFPDYSAATTGLAKSNAITIKAGVLELVTRS